MAVKQNSTNKKKNGEITRTERSTATRLAASVLKNVKEKTGDVIHVAISDRTTIELPADLTPEEIEARLEKYRKLRKSKI